VQSQSLLTQVVQAEQSEAAGSATMECWGAGTASKGASDFPCSLAKMPAGGSLFVWSPEANLVVLLEAGAADGSDIFGGGPAGKGWATSGLCRRTTDGRGAGI